MRKQCDPVIKACWDLRGQPCNSLEEEEAQYHRWLDLWRENLEGRSLDSVSLERANAILDLGAYLASMTDRHEEAVCYLDTLLSHPDRADLHPDFVLHHATNLIWSLLHIGDEHRVVEVGQSLLNRERRYDRTMARNRLRDYLKVFFSTAGGIQQQPIASAELTDFVWSLVLLYKRCPVRRQLPDRATYQQLEAVLFMTHSPKERALFASYADGTVFTEERQRCHGSNPSL